jgi:O-antigen ligase
MQTNIRMKRLPGPGAKGIPRLDDVPAGIWWGSLLFLVVTFIRPQDFVPGLSVLKLGMLTSAWLLFAWFSSKERDYTGDILVKLYFSFVALLASSIIVVANHFWYLMCVQDMTVMGIAWFLVLPAALRTPEHRRTVLRLLLVSFTFVAGWVVTHNGKGPSSFMGDENDAAAALNCALGLCFWTARLDPDARWRLLGYAAAGLCVAGVIISGSRGGFLGMVAALTVIALLTGRLVQSMIIAGLLVVAAIPFLPDGYIDEMRTITNTTGGTRVERIYSWNRGMDLFMKSPIIGVGANQYPWRLPEVEHTAKAIAERNGQRSVAGRAAHSMYFTLIPETGIVGTSIFLAMAWIAFKRAMAWRKRTAPEDRDRRQIALFILSGGAGVMVSGAFISTLYYPWFWFLAALAIVLGANATSDSNGRLTWQFSRTHNRKPVTATGTKG